MLLLTEITFTIRYNFIFFVTFKFVSILVKTLIICFRKIRNGLRFPPETVAWIGATYSVELRIWRWIQGHGANYASADSILWHRNRPHSNYKLNACVSMNLYYEPLSYNDRCSKNLPALCEVAM